ncbi:MAG: cupin domain-containing protein [Saprospiraceae bacterium]
MKPSIQQIIETLDLEPLEMEGGYFTRTYTSSDKAKFNIRSKEETRPTASAIYYLLTPDTHSKIHCLPTDEVYHFYLGDPVELLLLKEEGDAQVVELGTNILENEKPQFVVSKNIWQGSRLKSGGEFALLGTTMAPAFEYSDFEVPGDLEQLLKSYPKTFHELINTLF